MSEVRNSNRRCPSLYMVHAMRRGAAVRYLSHASIGSGGASGRGYSAGNRRGSDSRLRRKEGTRGSKSQKRHYSSGRVFCDFRLYSLRADTARAFRQQRIPRSRHNFLDGTRNCSDCRSTSMEETTHAKGLTRRCSQPLAGVRPRFP